MAQLGVRPGQAPRLRLDPGPFSDGIREDQVLLVVVKVIAIRGDPDSASFLSVEIAEYPKTAEAGFIMEPPMSLDVFPARQSSDPTILDVLFQIFLLKDEIDDISLCVSYTILQW